MPEIYALSDDILTPDHTILNQAREILECGVKFFQFRSKKQPKNEFIAKELLKICGEYGAKFIINDDVEFAAKIGAKCVHIGRDDDCVASARAILGNDAYIGVSCYDDLNLALKAQDEGASYAAFGAVFASPTKPNAVRVSLETIERAKEILSIPVCVIGGINASNIARISALNVDMIAVIGALYTPSSIMQNILNLKARIDSRA